MAAVNDAAVITGTSTGAVDEDAVVNTATGDLLATDVDNAADAFQAVAAGAATSNGYGTYAMTAAGVWTYTLDNDNAAVNALNQTSTPLQDTFTVYSEDGTAQVVTVTITGSNDAINASLPLVFTGTGDTNDFDNLGSAGTQVINDGNANTTRYGGADDDTLNGQNGATYCTEGPAMTR